MRTVRSNTVETADRYGQNEAAATAVPARLLLLAGVAVAAVRWLISHQRDVFHLTPDEPGQLAIARFLGGAARWNMLDRSTWRPGFGTLLAPIYWFTSDPVVVYHVALGVNAVLGGLSCIVLCLLARRLTTLSGQACVAVAVLVALTPAVLFTTNWAWSESLVTLTFLVALLTMMRFDDQPSLRRGALLVAVCAAGFATHSRLLPLTALAAAVVVYTAVRRRITALDAALLVLLAAVLTWLVRTYSAWLVDRIWESPRDTNTVGGLLDRLIDPAGVAISAVGQIWYQLVATAGLAGVGVVVLVRAARRRSDGTVSPRPARLALLATGTLVAVSMVFMADRLRPDRIVYGRYNDAIIGPILVAGIGALVTMRWAALARVFAAMAATMVAALAVLQLWRGDELGADGTTPAMILGIRPYLVRDLTIDPVAVTVAALGVLAVVALAACAARRARRPSLALLALVPLLLVAGLRTREDVDRNLNSWALPDAARRELHEVLPPGQPVRMRIVPTRDRPAAAYTDQRLRSMLYQFYLPENALSVDGTDGNTSSSPFVFAPLGDDVLEAAGAVVVWRDPTVPMALWREPDS